MKIQRKTLFKWDIQELQSQKYQKKAQDMIKCETEMNSLGAVFGLPKSILQEPKLSEVKTPSKTKKNSIWNYLQSCDTQAPEKDSLSQLRTTLKHRAKQLIRPLRKHNSVIGTIREQRSPQKVQMKINKKAPISSDHSSQKALNILEKIILKEADFYANKGKANMELIANKLPMISLKESKRKQSLAAYQARLIIPDASLMKFDTIPSKSQRPSLRKQKEKPYLSGWDVIETNDF